MWLRMSLKTHVSVRRENSLDLGAERQGPSAQGNRIRRPGLPGIGLSNRRSSERAKGRASYLVTS